MRDGGAETVTATGSVLDLVLAMLESLRAAGIDYCYWRSTRRLEAALSGLSDLDLLVARGDRERTLELLLGHDFKLLSSLSAQDEPMLMDLIGYDVPSGRIVHVHLHFRLMLGSSLLKLWRLPWDAAVLANAVWHPSLPVRVLDAPTEAVLLLVRTCLEFNFLDVVALRQWRPMVRKFATDRAAMSANLARDEIRQRATELLGSALAESVADIVCRGDLPSTELRSRLLARLAPYRRADRLQGSVRLLVRSLLFLGRSLNKRFIHAPRPWSHRILPSISLTQTTTQVGGFGSLDTTNIHNLAGKFRAGFGTPFDLAELAGIPDLDISMITHVRITDVVGSINPLYRSLDSQGRPINDPWETPFETGGFDLDAVAFLNIPEPATLSLLLLGVVSPALIRRRTRG